MGETLGQLVTELGAQVRKLKAGDRVKNVRSVKLQVNQPVRGREYQNCGTQTLGQKLTDDVEHTSSPSQTLVKSFNVNDVTNGEEKEGADIHMKSAAKKCIVEAWSTTTAKKDNLSQSQKRIPLSSPQNNNLRDWKQPKTSNDSPNASNKIRQNKDPPLPAKASRPSPFKPAPTSPPYPNQPSEDVPPLHLTVTQVELGLQLVWDQRPNTRQDVAQYELQGCLANSPDDAPTPWKTVGKLDAIQLPMQCILGQKVGKTCFFRIRGLLATGENTDWSEHVSISVK